MGEHLTEQPKVEQFYSPELKRVFTEDEAEKVRTPLGIQWRLEGKPTSHFGRESFIGEKPIPMPMALYQEGRRAFGLPEITPETMAPWQMTQSDFIEEQKKNYEKAGLKIIKGTKLAEKFESYHKEWHKDWVKTVLEEGKFVPERVLKDYPNLAKSFIKYFD